MATLKEKADRARDYINAQLAATADPDEQAELNALLGAGERALARLGDGVLKQDEFNRLADKSRRELEEAALWKANLDKWHQDKNEELVKGREALTALEKMRRAGRGAGADDGSDDLGDEGGAGGRAPRPDIDPAAISATIQTEIAKAGAQLVNMQHFLSALQAQHHKEFGGELLDTAELSAFCQKNGLDYRSGYAAFVSDRRKDLAEKTRKEELDAAERRGRDKAMSEIHGAPPPYAGIGAGPAFADHLNTAMTKASDRPADRGVAAAVAAYAAGKLKAAS